MYLSIYQSINLSIKEMNAEKFVADLKNAPWPDLKNFNYDINDAWGVCF